MSEERDGLALGVDCVAALAEGRRIAFGWARGAAAELSVSAGADGACEVAHCAFHPREGAGPALAFALVFDAPAAPDRLELALAAEGDRRVADLLDPAIPADAGAWLAARPEAAFALLREAARQPPLAALLGLGAEPLGAFAAWLGALPLLRGGAQALGRVAEAEALQAPTGELLLMLRLASGPLPEAEVAVAALGWLPGPEGIATPAPLAFADLLPARLPGALGCYARLDPAWPGRVASVELVVQLRHAAGQLGWLRCRPDAATVPALLEAASRGAAATLPHAPDGAEEAALGFMTRIAARREAAFAPLLGAPGFGTARGADATRTALLVGAEDPAAARLLHLCAWEFARRFRRLLALGATAEPAARALARDGRLEVLTGAAAQQALRAEAGRGGVVAVDAVALAAAIIEGRPEAGFETVLEGAEVARLLALHQVAGCAPALSDSLQRLLALRDARGPHPRFAPLPQPFANRAAAAVAAAHLRRLWGAEPDGGAAHG